MGRKMSRSYRFTCNICGEELDRGTGMAIKVRADIVSQSNSWEDADSHVCPNCIHLFMKPKQAQQREQALTYALEFCVHVIEKGIAARMGDQWPAIRDVLPDAVSRAKAALSL
jgi:predicted RNA-binding Zn-ribbon protein involved in translation (DUF1610 family)